MAKSLKSKEARTRGPDPARPLNAPAVQKKARRVTDLLGEHRDEMLNDAKELSRSGATDFEIAQHFGVKLQTIRSWRSRDAGFNAACQHYQMVADGRVEASLYERAVGYSYASEEIRVVDKRVVRVKVVKHVEPSVQAQIFWLKNRQGDRWKDAPEGQMPGQINVNMPDTDPRTLAMAIIAALREAAMQGKNEPAALEAAATDDEATT